MPRGFFANRNVSFLTHNRYDPETGCWNWTANKTRQGYGQMSFAGRVRTVHRLSAHFYLGFDLDSPLFVCHRCDNPSCFNPKHLFVGTNSDNIKDAVMKGRLAACKATHCPRGHEYTGDNLRIGRNGARFCRTCARFHGSRKQRALRALRKAAKA